MPPMREARKMGYRTHTQQHFNELTYLRQKARRQVGFNLEEERRNQNLFNDPHVTAPM